MGPYQTLTSEELFGEEEEEEKKPTSLTSEQLFHEQIQPPKKTFLKDVVSETLRGAKQDLTDTFTGIKETGAALATGMPAWIGTRLMGVVKFGWDFWRSGGKVDDIEDALDWANKQLEENPLVSQPKTKTGQAFTRAAVVPVELYTEGLDKFAKFRFPDDPQAQAATRYGGELLLIGAPFLKGALKANYIKSVKAGKGPARAMKEVIGRSEKVPNEAKTQIERLADRLLIEETKEPGLELRELQKRKDIRDIKGLYEETAPEAGIRQKATLTTQELLGEFAKEVEPEIPKAGLGVELRKAIKKPKEYQFEMPDIEARFQKAKGLPGKGISKPVQEFFISAWHKISREYEYLPHTAFYAPARTALTRLSHQRAVQFQKAAELVRGVTLKQNKRAHDLFTRKVILDDLNAEAQLGHHLPLGFDKNTLASEIARLDVEIGKSPGILKALRDRKTIWEATKSELINAHKDVGIDIAKRLTKEDYFRHQVLSYARAKGVAGMGKKLQVPTSRGFLKRRKGSVMDINTDYLQAEMEVLSQMLFDTQVAKTLKFFEKNYDISKNIKREARKTGEGANWREYIPEDYALYQPKEGNLFYLADSIPAKIAMQILEKNIDIGAVADNLKQALAIGAKRREWVIPEGLVKTLEEFGKSRVVSPVSKGIFTTVKSWKIWTLLSPRRFPKYNLRNLSGDADAAFVGNWHGFTKAPRSLVELWDHLVLKKSPSPQLRSWIERGGLETTLIQQELRTLKESAIFKRLYSEKFNLNLWKRYWNAVKGVTNFRESILRYANYLDYLEQMGKHPQGRPKNFGGSLREEVMALPDLKDRAFRLSNELLGAYDEISVAGQWIRKYLIPFWSWKELNFKRYTRFFRNAVEDGMTAQVIGSKLLSTVVRSPYTAYRVGKFALKAYAFWAMLEAWNNLMFPEIEASLPPDIKNRPHMNFGQNEEGEVIYFTRLGALGDALEWFGNEFSPHTVVDFLSGKKSLKEVAETMAKGPAEEVIRGMSPFHKLPFEMATRQSLFPEPFNPSLIRDRGLQIARQLGLENEYMAISGKPTKPYKKTLLNFFAYKADVKRLAYRKIMDMKRDYMKDIGKKAEGFWLTPRGNALYDLKLAYRYGDKKAVETYMSKYINYYILEGEATGRPLSELSKGVMTGLKRSLLNMHPLTGMNKYERTQFLNSLDEDERHTLAEAMAFYNEVLLGNTKVD